MKRAAFPLVTLVASAIASSLVNLGLIMLVFGAVLVAIGRFPGWIALTLVAPIAITIALASGLGILLGTLNVLFRDVAHATGIVLQFWFWLTPIVYPASILPDRLRGVATWNPLTPLVGAFQSVILAAEAPHWKSLGAVLVVAIVAFAMGYALFKGNAATLVDEL